jgi:type IV secretion system protein VirB11
MPILGESGVEEMAVNQPGEVWIYRAGGWNRMDAPYLTARRLQDMARLLGTYSNQDVGTEEPLLSGNLPVFDVQSPEDLAAAEDGPRRHRVFAYRIQVVMPPACPPEQFGLTIRKLQQAARTLEDYEADGFFDPKWRERHGVKGRAQQDAALRELYAAGRIAEFLSAAVAWRRNILLSGATGSGKTTFLSALLKQIPQGERVITIEDTRELDVPHPNQLNLVASAGGQGVARVDFLELLKVSLRLRPDRIIVGELRDGLAAHTLLDALNSGHQGGLTTAHANSPGEAFHRLASLITNSKMGEGKKYEQIQELVRGALDIVIQIESIVGEGRGMTGILFNDRGQDHGA